MYVGTYLSILRDSRYSKSLDWCLKFSTVIRHKVGMIIVMLTMLIDIKYESMINYQIPVIISNPNRLKIIIYNQYVKANGTYLIRTKIK